MGKKHPVPETEKSAFESAKAEFERAGEEDLPVSKTVESTKAETDAHAAPETPVSETDSPASEETSASEADNTAPDETSAPDAPDETDGPATDETDASAPDETPVSEPDAAPETDSPDASETSDEPDETDASETPETSDEADVPDAPEEAPPAPETPLSQPDDASEPDDEDGFPDFPDYAESEVTEMEKPAMETKEITLGYHRSPSAESDTKPFATQADKEPKVHDKKPRFKALDQLKDALRNHEPSDDNQTSGSSRDAALRKRVMQIDDEETRNYLLDRVLPQMTWYSKKSSQYQTMYYRLMAATIFLGALIPAFSVGANGAAVKVILALLGASVTGINAYLALHNYHDLWITYRTTREDLIHQLYCYFNRAGVFSSAEDLNVLLVNVCEDALSKEQGGWATVFTKNVTAK